MIDAAQSAGCLDIDAQELGVDFIAFSGHKGLMGPLGTGGLYVKNPQQLQAVITGGTGSDSENLTQPQIMPDMLHSGTVNATAIAALGEGVRFILKEGAGAIGEKERYLAYRLDEMLGNTNKVKLYGARHKTGISAFNIEGMSSGEAEEKIGDGIALRSGYHCAPKAHEALGTADTGALRISFGAFDNMGSVNKAYKIIKEAI